jgi:hypothetical protein
LLYPKVLDIDQVAYLPLNREEASLSFRLIAGRYEQAATVLTSNKGFVEWGEIVSDQVIGSGWASHSPPAQLPPSPALAGPRAPPCSYGWAGDTGGDPTLPGI